MRIGSFVRICAITALLAIPSAIAAEGAAPTYLLSMTLKDGEHVVGNPRLRIAAGEPAQIRIGEADGASYDVKVLATPRAGSTVNVASDIDIVSAAGVHRSASPALVVDLGEASAIAFGADSATQKPFRIDFTLERVVN